LNITTMPWPPRPQSFCRTFSTLSISGARRLTFTPAKRRQGAHLTGGSIL
jgi:hypothetical protein